MKNKDIKITFIVKKNKIKLYNNKKLDRLITVCNIKSPKFKDRTGVAIFNPQDKYKPLIGEKTALNNAIKGLSKNTRKKIWDIYLTEYTHLK